MSDTPLKEAPAKPKPPRTRPCAHCGKQMPTSRGVCANCGHKTTWLKVRLYIGGTFLVLGALAILIEFILALWGTQAK